MRTQLLLLILTLFSSTSFASVEQDVEILISKVERSSCTFIRNGKRHTQQEAGEHLLRKWDYAKDEVTDIQVFIDEVATKSWFSGKPYMVECGNKTITSQKWLNDLWLNTQPKVNN